MSSQEENFLFYTVNLDVSKQMKEKLFLKMLPLKLPCIINPIHAKDF